jgi:hypothetical protein
MAKGILRDALILHWFLTQHDLVVLLPSCHCILVTKISQSRIGYTLNMYKIYIHILIIMCEFLYLKIKFH